MNKQIVMLAESESLPGGSTTLMHNIKKLINIDLYKVKWSISPFERNEIINHIYNNNPDLKYVLIMNYEKSDKEKMMSEADNVKELLNSLDEKYNRHIGRVKIDPDRYKAGPIRTKKIIAVEYVKDIYDYVLSYNNSVGELYGDKYIRVDFNLYPFVNDDFKPNYNTGNWGYISRYQGFKGIAKFYTYLIEQDDFGTFLHYGLSYHINKKGTPSGPPGEIILFCNSLKDKTVKPNIELLESNFEKLSKNKFNAYGRYFREDLPLIMSKISLAICPTLGVRPNLTRDIKDVEKAKDSWKMALEYTNFELADYKIPTMYSKYFIEAYEPDWMNEFPELIYNDYQDAISKSKELLKQPDELERLGKLQNQLIKEKTNNLSTDLKNLFEELLQKF